MKTFFFLILIACIFALQKNGLKAVAKQTASTTVDGSASSDPNPLSHIVRFEWSQFSGAKCNIVSPNKVKTEITGMTLGTYVFILKVWSSDGLTDTCHKQINVVR